MTPLRLFSAAALLACLFACASPRAPQPDLVADQAARVNSVADRYYAGTLSYQPETAAFAAIETDRHDGLSDNSLAALGDWQRVEDALLAELETVDADALRGRAEWITLAYLRQTLQASIDRRVCRHELWGVNQMGGWHLNYPRLAELQPVDTAVQRTQSLARWSKFAGFVNTERRLLEVGLEEGYSAPKAVVQRVLSQLNGLLALEAKASPFYSPAARSDDPDFASRTLAVVQNDIHPALIRYRDFLRDEYLPAAREALSITANPNGAQCYRASLYYYTTIDRSPRDVYNLGQRTVADNAQAVMTLGESLYGESEFEAILARAKSDPNDRFTSREELLQFSRDSVTRAADVMPGWVGTMPDLPVAVVPFPEHEEGTGRSAHYRRGTKTRPAEYRIPLYKPEEQSRGNAEAVAFHEAWPGHHLQSATAKSIEGLHPVTNILWFSGPGEGWARYSEALAEEMGLYLTKTGPVLRRAWPARGMVVDPGLHVFGWTREQAKTFMGVSGRFPDSQLDAMVDRIAILPGQLTAYDSGGLEILALRREAMTTMGDDFDIRDFHDRVLENGTIPLGELRRHVEAWLAEYSANQ